MRFEYHGDEGSTFLRQFQAAGPAIFRGSFADDMSLVLQSIYCRSHGSGCQQHFALNLSDGQRAFVEQGFKNREVTQAQTFLCNAVFHEYAEGLMAAGQNDPELTGCRRPRHRICIQSYNSALRVVRAPSKQQAPAPRLRREATIAKTRRWYS